MIALLHPTNGSPRVRVVACDPGRVAIATCGEWVLDQATGLPRWASWRLSRSEFYHATGYRAAMRRRSLWNLEVATAHAALATVSVRTSRVGHFDAYLRVLETHLEDLWANRQHSRWMRLVRVCGSGSGCWLGVPAPHAPWLPSTRVTMPYSYPCCSAQAAARQLRLTHPPPPAPPAYQDFTCKRAALMCREGFWRRVRAGRACDGTLGLAPIVAYGDAGFASSGKGGMAAPTSAMRRSCVAVFGHASVVAVDEYNTTAKHAVTPLGGVCGAYLADVIDQRVGHCKRARCCGSGAPPRGAAGGVKARGLKRCAAGRRARAELKRSGAPRSAPHDTLPRPP